MVDDPRFETFATRRQFRTEFIGELEMTFAKRTTAEWIVLLAAAGVPCSAVNTVAEALAEPHAAVRGSVVETEHPGFGTVRSMASAVRVGEPMTNHRRAPILGEHTRLVLGELCGYSSDKIDGLVAAGAVGEA